MNGLSSTVSPVGGVPALPLGGLLLVVVWATPEEAEHVRANPTAIDRSKAAFEFMGRGAWSRNNIRAFPVCAWNVTRSRPGGQAGHADFSQRKISGNPFSKELPAGN